MPRSALVIPYMIVPLAALHRVCYNTERGQSYSAPPQTFAFPFSGTTYFIDVLFEGFR
jgi:hypothetical protein